MTATHHGEELIANRPHEGPCPATHGNCGFNAFYRWETLLAKVDAGNIFGCVGFDVRHEVLGVISAQGDTVLDEWGFRSAGARLEALVAHRASTEALGTKLDLKPRLQEIADSYGIALLEPEEIEAFCWAEGLEILPDQDYEAEVELAPEREERSLHSVFAGPPPINPPPALGSYSFSWAHVTRGPQPAPTRLKRFLRAMKVWSDTWPL